MKKKLYVHDSDEGVVTDYLKEWGVNFKRKGDGFALDANEIDGVSMRLTDLLILHVAI